MCHAHPAQDPVSHHRCHSQRAVGLLCMTPPPLKLAPPGRHPQHSPSSPRGAGREAWGTGPGPGRTASHKSFDLILAAAPREGCHDLHLTVDAIDAQRGQVAVQSNLVGQPRWNSRPSDSTNHRRLSLPASSARWALGSSPACSNVESGQENSQMLRAALHGQGGRPTWRAVCFRWGWCWWQGAVHTTGIGAAVQNPGPRAQCSALASHIGRAQTQVPHPGAGSTRQRIPPGL